MCSPRREWGGRDLTCLCVELGRGLDDVLHNEVGQGATEGEVTVEGTRPHLARLPAHRLTAVGSCEHNTRVTNTTLVSQTQHSGHEHYTCVTNTTLGSPTTLVSQTLHSGHQHYTRVTNTTLGSPTLHSCHKHNTRVTNTTLVSQTLHS